MANYDEKWTQIINQERIMVTNGECIPFLERIMQIQPYPIIYAPVAVLEIQICHIVSTRRILENVISIVKANKTYQTQT